MATRAPMKMSLLYLNDIIVRDIPDLKYELVLFVGSEAIKLQTKDNRIWEPVQRPDISPTSEVHVEILVKTSYLPLAKKDQNIKRINLQKLFNGYWTSKAQELTVSEVLVVGKHRFSFELRFSASPTAETLRSLVKELEGLLKKQSTMMDAPTERVVDKAIKYGAVIADLHPLTRAVFGIARLLNEQIKYDQMPSSLSDQLQRILPLNKKVADDVICEESEILEKHLQQMFEVIQKVAEFSRDYVKAKAVGGPANQEKFEEMDKELTKVIEDFNHAVEALHLAIKNGPEQWVKAKL